MQDLIRQSASEPGQQTHHSNRTSLLSGKRIVVVEDEGVTQMQFRRLLTRAGLVVLESAVTGEEGVEIVLRERPDLVLMDITMPGGMNGLQAAEQILSEYSVCIIMITAYSQEEYQTKAEEIQTCGYVIKPVTAESLLPALEAAFRKFGQP